MGERSYMAKKIAKKTSSNLIGGTSYIWKMTYICKMSYIWNVLYLNMFYNIGLLLSS